MKKIAIITVYRNINFGSVLQAYALQATLKKFNIECETLKFLPNALTANKQKSLFIRLLRLLMNPPLLFKRIVNTKNREKEYKFTMFLKEFIRETENCFFNNRDLESISNNYDAFLSGSDQIWSPKQFNSAYFLGFCNNKKKIAYAPSIGMNEIPEHLKNDYKSLIRSYTSVSVRESHAANIIERLVGFKPEVVLDPTMLLSPVEWTNTSKEFNMSEPYILCYFLGNSKEHRQALNRIKKETGLKTAVIPSVTRDYFYGDTRLYGVGPREFIFLVKNATMICTDSLHGIIFSINFSKEFIAFLRFQVGDPLSENIRVFDFLERFDLLGRLVKDAQNLEINFMEKIDYKKLNLLISSEKAKSMRFLEKALEMI